MAITGVMRLLPALTTCQAGRGAVGCAGKRRLGPECQLDAGLAWAPELSGGLEAVKQSQTNAFPSHIPASQWWSMPCCHGHAASRAGPAVPLLSVTLC